MKRLIDPGEQIAVDEQLLAQQGGEIGQAPAEAGAQLQILEQEQGDERGPDLNLQSVGAGADEGLDAKILLQSFEKQFDLPALAVDGGDGGSGKAAMIGEEDEGAVEGVEFEEDEGKVCDPEEITVAAFPGAGPNAV